MARSTTLKVYAYIDGLDEARLSMQRRLVDDWAADIDVQVLDFVDEPFVKRMKFVALQPVLTWCVTFGTGIVVARTEFLSVNARFLKQTVGEKGINIFSADIMRLRGNQGLRESVSFWRTCHEVSVKRSFQSSQSDRVAAAKRVNEGSAQDRHDWEMRTDVAYALTHKMDDKALAAMLDVAGRRTLSGARYTEVSARKLRRNVMTLVRRSTGGN